jgi:hypothetical protein
LVVLAAACLLDPLEADSGPQSQSARHRLLSRFTAAGVPRRSGRLESSPGVVGLRSPHRSSAS